MSPPSVSTKAISFLRFQPPAYGDSEKITYPALAVKATLLDLGFNKEVFSFMGIGWIPTPPSNIPDKFHEWRKLKTRPKGTDSVLWITNSDAGEYFQLER
jgi:hypothetical protein